MGEADLGRIRKRESQELLHKTGWYLAIGIWSQWLSGLAGGELEALGIEAERSIELRGELDLVLDRGVGRS